VSEHRATVEWQRAGEFRPESYSRCHVVRFDEIAVPGTAAPGNIPSPALGGPGMDPEQAFVAALSSCHLLWFLHLACRKNWVVERYVDKAVGILDKTWISRVTLRPQVTFAGAAPSREEHLALHHAAHERCFIASSVKTEVVIEPC
jgi:organic hydroperoxide reductase OsmC/OhrA